MKCGCSKIINGSICVRCPNEGVWRHPKWDDSVCDPCFRLLEPFYPMGWERIEGTLDEDTPA